MQEMRAENAGLHGLQRRARFRVRRSMFVLAQSGAGGDVAVTVGVLLGIVIAIALYFIPTVIAVFRGHHNAIAIFGLNLFLGWSFIGWVASLIWSLTAVER
ncbi:MAG: superinfection immunity protein [Gammaproteobacteria bacterium]